MAAIAEVCSVSDVLKRCDISALPWAMQEAGLIHQPLTQAARYLPSSCELCVAYVVKGERDNFPGNVLVDANNTDATNDNVAGMSLSLMDTLLHVNPVLAPMGLLRQVNVLLPVARASFTMHTCGTAPMLYSAPTQPEYPSMAKLAHRRAQAGNELVASEATYISKMLRLVGAFVLPLAAKPLEVPAIPAGVVRHAPFGISEAVTDVLHSTSPPPSHVEEACGDTHAAASGSQAQPNRVRQLVRYSSSGSRSAYTSSERIGRRFSWLGGAKDPHTLLSGDTHARLFRDVHSLLSANFDVLQGLQDALIRASNTLPCVSAPNCPPLTQETALSFEVGELMLAFSSDLLRYSTYVSNFSTAATQLSDLKSSDSAFARWLQGVEGDPARGQGHTLESFLILPVQRVPRYSMLLRALMKYTPESHPDYANLHAAITGVESAAATINDAIASQHPVLALEAALYPPPSRSIVSQEQVIYRTGWLSKVVSDSIRTSKEYLFVQLSDRLLYASVDKANEGMAQHRINYVQQIEELPALQITMSAEHSELIDAPEVALPSHPLPLDRSKLHLHNVLQLQRIFPPVDVDGRITMQLEATPKPISLIFRSWPEAIIWHDSLKALVGKTLLEPIGSQATPSQVHQLRKQSESAAFSSENSQASYVIEPRSQIRASGQCAVSGAGASQLWHNAGTLLHSKQDGLMPIMTSGSIGAQRSLRGMIGPGSPILRIGGIFVACSDSNRFSGQCSVQTQVRKYLSSCAESGEPVLLSIAVL